MAELSNTMNDTTLSYQSQIDAINEIAAAYGVQVDAIDAVSGAYERLKSKITGIAQANARQIVADAEAAVEEADNAIDQERQIRINQNNTDNH